MPTITQRPLAEHYSKTRSPITPWGVLLHTTEGGSKAGLDDLFIHNHRGDGVTVSVHFAIYLGGEIYCYGKWKPGECWYMYHAGQSLYEGLSGVSSKFIGIEIQHRYGQPYSQAQLDSLKYLLATIQAAYKGKPGWRNSLTEHKIVAWPRGRKPDPTYPWDQVKGPIYAAWNAPTPPPVDQYPLLRYVPGSFMTRDTVDSSDRLKAPVHWVQRKLNTHYDGIHGHPAKPALLVDGCYGEDTEGRLILFQMQHWHWGWPLTVSGDVDKRTWQKLTSV